MPEDDSWRSWRSLGLTGILLIAWAVIPQVFNVPTYVFPDLMTVLREFGQDTASLLKNLGSTAWAAAGGLALAVLVGSIIASVLAVSSTARRQALPLMIAANAVPVVALAPLLSLWLGHGLASKIALAAFLCFFPFTLSLLDGLGRDKRVTRELFATLGANWQQRLMYYRLPNAMGAMLTGLKVSASVAVIGAIVGEFIGSDRGLGFGILQASYSLNTPRLFAYVLAACVLSICFYIGPALMEREAKRRGYLGD